MKMNPEAKTKLLAALRSGDYKQGIGQLRGGDCHCVWGVVCDVSGQGEWSQSGNDWYYSGALVFAPRTVEQWSGLKARARVTIDGVCTELIAHNDQHRVPFAKIADAIEQQL